MPDLIAAEKMLFNYETTNLSDYRKPELGPPVLTKYKEKPRCLAIRPRPLKDVHTLSEWKAAAIPFDLLHTQKPIVRSNPWTTQKKYGKVIINEEEHARVMKTRPRLVMTPAVSMDDIEDMQTRRVLCHDMYTTDATRGQREAVAECFNVCAPFPKHPAPSNPIILPKLKEPLVSPEWRMESVSWDNKQQRGHCDPTKEFWLRSKPIECKACDESAVVTSHRRKLRQQRTN